MSRGGILYSFRRCPYAIRARLALDAAGIAVEVREVALKAKPPELLEASARATVPVLARPDGETLVESLDILLWALRQRPEGEQTADALQEGEAAALLADCDGPFKRHLDHLRYGAARKATAHTRHGSARSAPPPDPAASSEAVEASREAALAILRRWSRRLEALGAGGAAPSWLPPLCWALLPFVRQFRLSDPEGWAKQPDLAELQQRLATLEASAAFARVMAPPWAYRQPWLSPRWLYHLALEDDWQAARLQGAYTRSTRGLSLEEAGFIHASWRHQLTPTWQRFYSDDPPLRLLIIDPERLRAAAIPVREEPAPGSGERFPHLYGALPIDAVGLALPWEAPAP
ncbi:MAG: hypothetical protein RLZZ117_1662 [Cyanobacteriota bacterium]|jgi:glutathione S-transferase